MSMLLMLSLSIPLYTCASFSTPLAAALALKGLSPGAALVFLLAGPATNIGSVVVLLKVLGGRAVAVYLVAVAAMTFAAGFVLNALYYVWGLDPRATFGVPEISSPVQSRSPVRWCSGGCWSSACGAPVFWTNGSGSATGPRLRPDFSSPRVGLHQRVRSLRCWYGLAADSLWLAPARLA